MGDLGDRMKAYERAHRTVLTPRTPVIVRVDGKAFHTYTRGCAKPFDAGIIALMNKAALALCEEVDGAQFAYVQSDEISILIHTYRTYDQSPWFGNVTQKIASVTAGIASGVVTQHSASVFGETRRACFDSRAFTLPEADVCNYYIWRQQDWTRNSVQMLARSLYSSKQCHRKNQAALQEMCWQKGHNWNDLPVHLKRGRCVVRVPRMVESGEGETVMRHSWMVDDTPPIFTQHREYVERHLAVIAEAAEAAE